MIRYLLFVSGIMGAMLFVIASILGGLQIEGYSFIGQYISESFSSGLPNTGYLRVMYVISGFLLLVFGVLAPSFLPKLKGIKLSFYLFAIFYGLGTIIVSIFPCDFGCPTDVETVSIAQFIHNTTAFFTYTVVPFCIIGSGLFFKSDPNTISLSRFSLISGILSLVFVVLLFNNTSSLYIGLFQRIIESSILGWVISTSFFMFRTSKK
ncbi:DUF998 domain-containing protein [Aurantibacter crassamenti]|uniref:DUF998 domain-containing protein n=1 Tax=Aurantibacter crassamenti TaxID=1837375 RepID=UPI0019393759|nr:DUF998 domain-containing protein [Aurantibacter crassamenti]MBM1105664.1 DUF998 domain-containing protein [Aurantibacter crassamenti]